MSRTWVTAEATMDVPSPARIVNYALGGNYHRAADRRCWDDILAAYPAAAQVEYANFAVTRRTVAWLLDSGIRQILDLGAGIPDIAAPHELARENQIAVRVIYTDVDPVAVDLTTQLIDGLPRTWALHADLADPTGLADLFQNAAALFDFGEPAAVLATQLLPFLSTGACTALLERVAEETVTGSYLILTHPVPEATTGGRARQENARRLYDRTPTPMRLRNTGEITGLLSDAWQILPPGVCPAGQWHPDSGDVDDPMNSAPSLLAVIARRTSTATHAADAAGTTAAPGAAPGADPTGDGRC
ncbi:SAM-dependent methyltransferase [Actinoplanes sp. CA-054009]